MKEKERLTNTVAQLPESSYQSGKALANTSAKVFDQVGFKNLPLSVIYILRKVFCFCCIFFFSTLFDFFYVANYYNDSILPNTVIIK